MVDEIRNHSDFLHGPYDVVLSDAVKGVEVKWVTEQALKQQAGEAPDKSGACITGAIIHRNKVTVVNVGDCRMVRYIAGQHAVQVRGEEDFRCSVARLSGCQCVQLGH
jgi:serine/threonine protein phosphatase PrpC